MAKQQPPGDYSLHLVDDTTSRFEVFIDRDGRGCYSVQIFYGDDLLRQIPIDLKKGESVGFSLGVE